MAKGAEAFRSIGEVAKLIGVAPHVLRYWETQFSLLKPMKRGDGRRYYRPDDVRLAAGLCEVLRDEGLTIRGAKKLLAKDRGETVRARGAIKLGESLQEPEPTHADITSAEPDEVQPAARSRARKRPVSRPPEPLPLFPEDAPEPAAVAVRVVAVDAAEAGWLRDLSRLSARLRAHRAPATLSDPARGQAQRLLDAIADHF